MKDLIKQAKQLLIDALHQAQQNHEDKAIIRRCEKLIADCHGLLLRIEISTRRKQ
jgi:hypothetical protein